MDACSNIQVTRTICKSVNIFRVICKVIVILVPLVRNCIGLGTGN